MRIREASSQQMRAAARALHADVLGAFRKLYQKRLAAALDKNLEKKRARAQEEGGETILAHDAAAAPQSKNPAILGPEHIFQLLDEKGDHNGKMSEEEFVELFKILHLPLTNSQKHQLFFQCDTNGDGVLTISEFCAGWKRIEATIAVEFLTSQGLSPSQILAAVLLSLTLLGLLFAFIFTALGGWSQTQDTFGSVTQTVLVSGTGKVVLLLRKRTEGELDDEAESASDVSRFLSQADDDDDHVVEEPGT